MFRGIAALNLDAKGRITIPTRYRDDLQEDNENQLVLTIDTEEQCLLLYPLAEWEVIEQKIAALPSFNVASRRIQRLLIGHATELDVDSNGRLLLPPLLREYAGIEKRVMLVGQGNKFELWAEALWQSSRDSWLQADMQNNADVPSELQNLSL